MESKNVLNELDDSKPCSTALFCHREFSKSLMEKRINKGHFRREIIFSY